MTNKTQEKTGRVKAYQILVENATVETKEVLDYWKRLGKRVEYEKRKKDYEKVFGTLGNSLSDEQNRINLSTQPGVPRTIRDYLNYLEREIDRINEYLTRSERGLDNCDDPFGLGPVLHGGFYVHKSTEEEQQQELIKIAKQNIPHWRQKLGEIVHYKHEVKKELERIVLQVQENNPGFFRRIAKYFQSYTQGNGTNADKEESDDTQDYTNWLKANTMKGGDE